MSLFGTLVVVADVTPEPDRPVVSAETAKEEQARLAARSEWQPGMGGADGLSRHPGRRHDGIRHFAYWHDPPSPLAGGGQEAGGRTPVTEAAERS